MIEYTAPNNRSRSNELSQSFPGTSNTPFTFHGEVATMESVRTVHSLEGELVRLRESTKDALQQAWEEVETLQQQCAAHLEITTQLESDFIETKKKEEYWHKRCLEAEKQLMQNAADTPPSSKLSLGSQEKNFIAWPSIRIMKNRASDESYSYQSTSVASSQMMSSSKSLIASVIFKIYQMTISINY